MTSAVTTRFRTRATPTTGSTGKADLLWQLGVVAVAVSRLPVGLEVCKMLDFPHCL